MPQLKLLQLVEISAGHHEQDLPLHGTKQSSHCIRQKQLISYTSLIISHFNNRFCNIATTTMHTTYSLVSGWQFAGRGLREAILGHLYIQVCKCVAGVAVVLVVFVSAVVKRFLRLWRYCCWLCRRKRETHDGDATSYISHMKHKPG